MIKGREFCAGAAVLRIIRPDCGMMTAFLLSLILSVGLVYADDKGAESAKPVNPFAAQGSSAHDYSPGAVYFSNGMVIAGGIRLTPGSRLLVFNPRLKRYEEIDLQSLEAINIKVASTRLEKEWRFKEGGSAEKVYTGKLYPRIDFEFEFVFLEGEPLKARLSRGAPLYVRVEDSTMPVANDGEEENGRKSEDAVAVKYLLQPFMTGEAGSVPDDLVYIGRVVLGDEAKLKALEDIRAIRKVRSTASPDKDTAEKADENSQKPKDEVKE